jgi:putative spermidine/putrescine transport system ATP-binding protein
MTVAENIAYPLQQRRPRPDRATIDRRVQEVLELVQMREFAGRRPDQLSGGQQQRVALARAVVFEPQLLLLDEPLGALDKRLRESLQGELRRIHRELGVTVVFVTHDQDEALSLSDRIVLFHDGAIEQVGTPEEIYDRPRTGFAATFLGDSNLFDGHVAQGRFAGPAGRFAPLSGQPDGPLTLMVRPEHVTILSEGGDLPAGADNAVPVTIDDVIFAGATVRVEALGADGKRLLAQSHRLDRRLAPGTAARFAWPASATRLLPRAKR